MLLPMQSLALSATTFVGQNLGRGNEPRARQGVRRALAIAMAATVLVMIPVLVLAPQMTAFFNGSRRWCLRRSAAAVYLPLLCAVLL